MQQIYILVNGEQQGPFTADQLKGYLAMGQYKDTDLAWHEGLPEWKALKDFPELAPRQHRTPNYRGMPVRNFVQKKKKKSPIISIIGTIVVLGALGTGGYFGYNYWQQHRKKDTAADSTAGGTQVPAGPKTLAELSQSYAEPPQGQNAATFFQQGFDAMELTDADKSSYSIPLLGRGTMPAPSAVVPGGVKTALKPFLDRNEAALALFERGAQCSGSRYPVDLSQGTGALLPHLAKLKHAAQLGQLYAMAQADLKDGAKATRGVSMALGSARTLESEPVLISQLARAGNEGLAVDALEQTLTRVGLSADSLTSLRTAFDRAEQNEASGASFNRAFFGERVLYGDLLGSTPDKIKALIAQAGSNSGNIPESSFSNLKEQQQFYVESIDQALTARNEAWPGRLKADESVTMRANDARNRQFTVAATFLAPITKATSREGSALARLRLAQVALGLEAFRAANQKYPEALTELAPKFIPAIPADPFDGMPLRYRKTPTGYLLHSIGPNAKDDAGARGSDDLPFAVVRAPK